MKFIEKIIGQCRKPHGIIGKIMGLSMNKEHAPMHYWALNHLKNGKFKSILDIGCGGGSIVNRFAKSYTNAKVFGIDYSVDMVAISIKKNKKFIDQKRVKIHHGNVSFLPFSDNQFDLITAFESYFFWPNLNQDFKEILRVLKQNGKFLIGNEGFNDIKSTKFNKRNEKWIKKSGMYYHTPEEFTDLLKNAGFREILIETNHDTNWICVLCIK